MSDRTHTATDTAVGAPEIAAIEEALAADTLDNEDAELAELEAEIAKLEAGEKEIEEQEITEEEIVAAITEVANDEIKAEIYAEQESTTDVVEEDAAEPSKPAKKAKATKATKAPKAPRPTFEKRSDALAYRIGGVENLIFEAQDADKSEEELRKMREDFLAVVDEKTAKKVQEKVINLLASATKGVKLSEYTRIALTVLFEKGTASSKVIYEAMIAAGYNVGTARSQSQQMMQLLPLVKIATRSKDGLTLNPNSVLAEAFKATLASAS